MEEEMVRPQGRLDLLLQNPQGTLPSGRLVAFLALARRLTIVIHIFYAGPVTQGFNRSRKAL